MFRLFLRNIPLLLFKKKSGHVHPPFRKPFSTIISEAETEAEASPTIEYLITSCGLSSKSALSVSKKIKLKNTKKSDYVLQILKDYDFSSKQIASAVSKYPQMLSMKPEINLKAKLDFFRSTGFSGPEVADILSVNPYLFHHNLKEKIIPSISDIKKLVPSKETVITVLKNNSKLIMSRCLFNMETLRSHGVPEPTIVKAFISSPRSIMCSTGNFMEAVEKAKELGLEPANAVFVRAVSMLSYMTRATWERKVALYKSLGWSDEQILVMFRKQPNSFAVSDTLIKERMNFFTNKLGWDPTFMVSNPVIMQMSLEKRVLPRCSVLNLLMSRGLIKKKTRSMSHFQVSKKVFLKQYVEKYKDQLPEVLEAYQGKMVFKGWA